MTVEPLKAPFPYFGGKSAVASLVWQRFGDVPNYVEPFFGSGAVLLARESEPHTETVNDADGLLANFWRALVADSAQVAHFADWPVNENDLHARHAWLVSRKDSIQARLEGDPDWFDAKAAGWWVWGICCWIGAGWCSGNGPWRVEDGQLVHAGDAGQGLHRKRVHAANGGKGVNRKRERLSGFAETGVNASEDLIEMFAALSGRLRRVRVCCGDWSRIVGPSVTFKHGVTAVFLDPPYRGGRRPHPNTLPCCGHVWRDGERRHEYHHRSGHGPDAHYDVESLCVRCHAKQEGKGAAMHCIHGHAFDDSNTGFRKNGTRFCYKCHRIRDRGRRDAAYWREYRARRKAIRGQN